MSRVGRWIVALLALMLTPALPAAAPHRPAADAARDWGQVAMRTNDGHFVLGNPAAKVRLVEILSFTCPHCAAFSGEMGSALIDRYVRSGKVSYEVRIALRDPFDMAAALLARCAGPQRFFAVMPALFAAQGDWLERGTVWAQTGPKLEEMGEARAMQAVAAGAGSMRGSLRAGFPKGAPRRALPICPNNTAWRTRRPRSGSRASPAPPLSSSMACRLPTCTIGLRSIASCRRRCARIYQEHRMFARRPATALILALSLLACSKKEDGASPATPLPTGPVAAVAPPAGKDWTEVATSTPEGGVLLGNPNAAIKFVEYASLTCPHCRDFTAEATEPFQTKYVRTGKVSWEYRPFILNSLDVAAFLLTRCRGPEPFFKLMEQAYADQNAWVGRFMQLTPEQQAGLQGADQSEMFKRIAAAAGLDGFFRARGLPAAQADKCLSDAAAAEALAQGTNVATSELNVTGTPTFFVNGKLDDTLHTWEQVDARLSALTG